MHKTELKCNIKKKEAENKTNHEKKMAEWKTDRIKWIAAQEEKMAEWKAAQEKVPVTFVLLHNNAINFNNNQLTGTHYSVN